MDKIETNLSTTKTTHMKTSFKATYAFCTSPNGRAALADLTKNKQVTITRPKSNANDICMANCWFYDYIKAPTPAENIVNIFTIKGNFDRTQFYVAELANGQTIVKARQEIGLGDNPGEYKWNKKVSSVTDDVLLAFETVWEK